MKIYRRIAISLSIIITGTFIVHPAHAWVNETVKAAVFGGASNDEGAAVAIDGVGNSYVGVNFRGLADFDPTSGTDTRTANTSVSVNYYDIALSKFDANGNRVWTYSFNGSGDDYIKDIVVDGSNNIYVGGYFSSSIDFNPTSVDETITVVGGTGSDAFISKYDASGNYLWTKTFGSANNNDFLYGLDVDAGGNIYAAGAFTGTTDFNPSSSVTNNLVSSGNLDGYVLKLNSQGEYIWAGKFGGSGIDYAQNVKVNASGDMFVAGYFNSIADFDPGTGTSNKTSLGGADAYLVKLNSSGAFQWTTTIGSSAEEYYAPRLAIDSSSNAYLSVQARGNITFASLSGTETFTVNGASDLELFKYSADGVLQWGKQLVGPGGDALYGLGIDSDANIYVVGNIGAGGPVNLDPANPSTTVTSNGLTDGIVWKLSSSGSYSGYDRFGAAQSDQITDIYVVNAGKFAISGNFGSAVSIDTGNGAQTFSHAGSGDAFMIHLATLAAPVSTSNNSSSSASSDEQIRKSREERAKAVEKAIGEIKSTLSSGKPLTVDQFAAADIFGVTAKNITYVNEEISQLKGEDSQNLGTIAKIVFKYEVAGRIEGSKTVYYPELVSAGLAPAESIYRTAVLRELKKLPTEKVDSLIEISAAVAEIQQKYMARKNRILEIIARISSRSLSQR